MKYQNICIVGGGSIAHALVAYLSSRSELSVRVLTRNPGKWKSRIVAYEKDSGQQIVGHPHIISDQPITTVADADLVLIALPAYARAERIAAITPFLREGILVGSIPGTGGFEWMSQDLLLRKRCIIFGTQRVPYICRLRDYGCDVDILGRKDSLYGAALPSYATVNVCKLVSDLLGIQVNPLNNYMSVTLTPSNPILHTSRLYALYKEYHRGDVLPDNPLFYEDWDDTSSEILLESDAELQQLCRVIPLDLRGVTSLREHYGVSSAAHMTKKLKSIQAFKGIYGPTKRVEGGYILDFNSRYFTEDFMFGLAIVKGIADLAECSTPYIDKMLQWYQELTNKTLLTGNKMNGSDVFETGSPQAFGIVSLNNLLYINEL